MLLRVVSGLLVLVCFAPPSSQAQSPQVLADGLQSLADSVVKEVKQGGKKKIAVVPFEDIAAGGETMFGRYIAEELVPRLFQSGNVEIVERQRLDALLAEAKLGMTGVIDPATARQIGKVAGVEALVTGTITDLQSFVALNARLVDTETGEIFGAAQVKIVRDDDVKKILAMALPKKQERGTGGARGTGVRESDSDEPPRPIQKTVVAEITFELLECRGAGAQISCDLRVTNGRDDVDLHVYPRDSRGFDEHGNEYVIQSVEIANTSASGGQSLTKRLVKGVPTPMRVRFEASNQVAQLSLLELRLSGGYKVQVRNIPVQR